MKKLIDEPGAVADEMFDGVVVAHSELRRLDGANILVRDDVPAKGRVAVISGGGLGHEPTRAGYLGEGMPDGAAVSEVFTSPTADQPNEMIQATDVGEGVLCVIKNYEDDMMNFNTAAETAGMEGVDVEQVVINDDAAVEDSLYTSGCRGVVGAIFVHECAGAKVAVDGDLDETTTVAEKVVDNVWTVGMVLTSCVIPGEGEPMFDLGGDEIELDIGIHGEPGTERADVMSADEITEHLTGDVLDDLDLGEGEEVMMMVNGVGGTSLSELYIVNRKLQSILDDRGAETWDVWVGDHITSLDMMGRSVSVLHVDDELKELLGVSVKTSGLIVTE